MDRTKIPSTTARAIVRRAVQNQMRADLAEVTGWHELSDDRLLGLWQRAFCYYLVDSIIEPGPRRDDFEAVAGRLRQRRIPSRRQFHFPTEKPTGSANWPMPPRAAGRLSIPGTKPWLN